MRTFFWVGSSLIGLTGLGGALYMYMVVGGFSGPLATTTAEWGQFGDYFGGVLGAVFGYISFVALLGTLLLHEHQIAKLSTESLKENLLQSMDAIHVDIQYLLKRRIATGKNLDVEFGDFVLGNGTNRSI